MSSVAAIVLAAGYSSRMPDFKPLVEIGGRSLLERAVAGLHDVGVADVVVVAGHQAEPVVDEAGRLGARAVVNSRYPEGMYSSVLAGVAAVTGSPDKLLLLPVDCGLVRPETVGRLLRAAQRVPGLVHYPMAVGRRGHPPVIDTGLTASIRDERPGGGLRDVLAAHETGAVDVEVTDPGVLIDIDTEDDLSQARSYAAGERVPGAPECLALLRARSLPAAVVAHSQAVADVADRLTLGLNGVGQHLCTPLVTAACLLHDVARPEPDHAAAGAALLEGLGFRRVAALVARHLDLEVDQTSGIGEAEVVYLADKLVSGDREVGLEEKLVQRRAALASRPDGLPFLEARMAVAAEIEAQIQALLGGAGATDGGAAPRLEQATPDA